MSLSERDEIISVTR